jgi:hypothetical protein
MLCFLEMVLLKTTNKNMQEVYTKSKEKRDASPDPTPPEQFAVPIDASFAAPFLTPETTSCSVGVPTRCNSIASTVPVTQAVDASQASARQDSQACQETQVAC